MKLVHEETHPQSSSFEALDLRLLHTFLVAAGARSFTDAAERLCLSQSAVSHAMARLEENLGLALWHRRGIHMRLTEEGEEMLRCCEKIFHELKNCHEAILNRNSGELTGRLRIGATVEFGNGVLARNLMPFIREHPLLKISLTFSHDLVTPLIGSDLDIIIDCWMHPREDIWRLPIFRERYLMLAAPSLLARVPLKKLADLRKVPWLTLDPVGSWWSRFLTQVPRNLDLQPAQWFPVNHIRGMVNLATAGAGVCLVPAYCVTAEIRAGSLKVLFPRVQIQEDWFSLYGKRSQRDALPVQAFIRFMQSWGPAEFGDPVSPKFPAGKKPVPGKSRDRLKLRKGD
jgi:DNA-binding transcriptional LysR family regulator